MKTLIKKEFLLAMHPTVLIFLALSAMLIIPNYPYYVTFFYTGLGIFFTCLLGRENNDIYYTLSLPIAKRSLVKARFIFVVICELIQMLVAIPFALLRQSFDMPGNEVGMDANIAFFGLSFIMLGIFNFIFLTLYYKNVYSVGKSFCVSSTVTFIYIMAAEVCAHAVPFFRDKLDTKDDVFVTEKLIVLIIGIIVFAVLTLFAYKKSAKTFEKLDV